MALAIGVPLRTVKHILADTFPEDPAKWKKFSKYVRKDVDFLRTGGLTHSITILNLSALARQSTAGRIRRIPLLNWHQLGQMV